MMFRLNSQMMLDVTARCPL